MHYLPLTSQLLRAKKKKLITKTQTLESVQSKRALSFVLISRELKWWQKKRKKKKKRRNTRILEDGPGGCPLPIDL